MEMDLRATHRLGIRAFMLFLIRHVKWAFFGMVIAAAGWFYVRNVPPPYFEYADYGVKLLFLLAVAVLLAKTIRAYFEYRGYAYRFSEEFFHITRGYLARQEIGVVYHQIQTVILRHAVMDRMIGVSHLIIVMNGANSYQPAEVVLPALDHRKARLVQQELLRQARIHMPSAYVSRDST